jgi:hypothetical protein
MIKKVDKDVYRIWK